MILADASDYLKSLYQEARSKQLTIDRIVSHCQRYANPSVNPGAHQLAIEVLKLAGERE